MDAVFTKSPITIYILSFSIAIYLGVELDRHETEMERSKMVNLMLTALKIACFVRYISLSSIHQSLVQVFYENKIEERKRNAPTNLYTQLQ